MRLHIFFINPVIQCLILGFACIGSISHAGNLSCQNIFSKEANSSVEKIVKPAVQLNAAHTEVLTGRKLANHPQYSPDATGAILDWTHIRDRVVSVLKEKNLDATGLTTSIWVNGDEVKSDLPLSQTQIHLPANPHEQADYYIIFKQHGREIDISDFYMHDVPESTDGQNLSPDSFSGLYSGELFGFDFGQFLQSRGVSARLSAAAVLLGYRKIVWILSPEADPSTQSFIANAKSGVDIKAEFGKDGRPQSMTITDRATKKKIQSRPENFFIKVDAAFNKNAFSWDDMSVAAATVPYHPWLAEQTIRFWLMVQKRNGGVIPREVRKGNLKSLWFPETIRAGEEPKANLSYTNPYLMNWVMDELYRFNPSPENLKLMKDVSHSIDQYTEWMEEHRSVKENGEIIGFNGSALGSGLDNSRGGVGNRGEPSAYKTGFVDFISQQISMYKDNARWNTLFANRSGDPSEKEMHLAKAVASLAKAKKFEKVLNERYWNQERGFYFDLVPNDNGGFKQNLKYTSIAGFWPLYAQAASPAQVTRMIEMQMTPQTFGGDFPYPANSRQSIDPNAKVEYQARPNYRDEDGYWDKWAHWPVMAMIAAEGFRRSGRPDIAFTTSVAYLKKMAESSENTVEENYGEIEYTLADGTSAFKSRPGQHATHQHRPDFAGWGKGPPLYLALKSVLGLYPTYDGVLEWDLRVDMQTGERLTVRNLQYGGATIRELTIVKTGENQYVLHTSAEREFNIRVSSMVDSQGKMSTTRQSSGAIVRVQSSGQTEARNDRIVLTALPTTH